MEEQNTIETTEQNYIEQIQNLKANSVDRKQYDKVIAENKQLTEALVNGGQIGTIEPQTVEYNIPELTESLKGDLSNLQYITNALNYRKAVLEKDGRDVFINFMNPQQAPSQADYEVAERVANSLQSAVDYANGDSAVFNSEFQRICQDVGFRR